MQRLPGVTTTDPIQETARPFMLSTVRSLQVAPRSKERLQVELRGKDPVPKPGPSHHCLLLRLQVRMFHVSPPDQKVLQVCLEKLAGIDRAYALVPRTLGHNSSPLANAPLTQSSASLMHLNRSRTHTTTFMIMHTLCFLQDIVPFVQNYPGDRSPLSMCHATTADEQEPHATAPLVQCIKCDF
jgi:hypothetical protein